MSDAEQREEAIFEAAVQTSPRERGAYLVQACGTDTGLRKRIEALLFAHENLNGFMERAAVPAEGRTMAQSGTRAEGPGDKIGQFKLLEQIGEGGWGVVYMAEQDEPIRRRVAIKIVKLGMDTKQVVARFEAERQALALMDHPNIAKVLDADATASGRPYFVMELVRGTKITDFCDHNNLPTQKRLELFIQVCRAVQHAHQKGVIHRDIKPSNILVTLHDGMPVPKVIDFGIAKATQGRLTDHTVFTAFEQFIGTPAYMSPEQAEMSGLDVDTRTDIYSLGVLLYELLTGRTPFDAKALVAAGFDGMRRTIREEEPVRPSTRLAREVVVTDLRWPKSLSTRNTLPKEEAETSAGSLRGKKQLISLLRGDLDWIVMKCLEKDRSRRYETANGLARDVERHLEEEPVEARPPSRVYRLKKLAGRHRGALFWTSAIAATLVVGLVLLAVSNVRIARERNEKDRALAEAKRIEQRAKEQLFQALRNQAQARRYSRKMGQRLGSLAAVADAARIRPDDGLRDEAMAAMALPDVRWGPKWKGWPPGSRAVAFDSTYQRYAFVDGKNVITIRSIPDDNEIQRFGSGGSDVGTGPQSLAFSPDGSFLARLEEGQRLRVWRISDGQPLLHESPEHCWGLAFGPDSRELAVGQEGSILCFDLTSGRLSNRWQVSGEIHSVAFHPDSRRLAVGYSSSAYISVYDSKTGMSVADLPSGPSTDQVVAWHPDGMRLAVAGSDPSIQIWDVDARRKVATLEGHVQQVTVLTFHPNGTMLASGGWDGLVRLWDPASGRPLMQLSLQISMGFSPDGRWLGVTQQEGQFQLLEVFSNLEYRTMVSSLGAGHDGYNSGDISPDGELLAMAMDDGVRLFDLRAGRELALLAEGPAQSVFFRSDGHALLTCSLRGGLQQWNIGPIETMAGDLRAGPPLSIQTAFAPIRATESAGSHTVAIVDQTAGEAQLLSPTLAAAGKTLTHPLASFVALSADGRWVATSGWHSDRIRLWNANSGALVQEWLEGSPAMVFFTPDSKMLIISKADSFSFWNVHTLELSRRFKRELAVYPDYVAFSRDGKIMALETAPGLIHLIEVATGRTVAKLEDPSGDRGIWMGFSPLGTELIVASKYASAIHIWNLQAIRAQLKTMDLDWDWPGF